MKRKKKEGEKLPSCLRPFLEDLRFRGTTVRHFVASSDAIGYQVDYRDREINREVTSVKSGLTALRVIGEIRFIALSELTGLAKPGNE